MNRGSQTTQIFLQTQSLTVIFHNSSVAFLLRQTCGAEAHGQLLDVEFRVTGCSGRLPWTFVSSVQDYLPNV